MCIDDEDTIVEHDDCSIGIEDVYSPCLHDINTVGYCFQVEEVFVCCKRSRPSDE